MNRHRRPVALAAGALLLIGNLAALGVLAGGMRLALAGALPHTAVGDDPGPAAVITLTAPLTLTVGGARTVVSAMVVDLAGVPVADGTAVLVDTSLGRFDSANLTTHRGMVTTTLESGRLAGVATVTAQAGEVVTRMQVAFIADAPADVSLTPGSPSVRVDEAVSLEMTARDAYGNLVRDGTSVVVAPSRGIVTPTVAVFVSGLATAQWQSTVAGTATVMATAGAANATAGVAFLPGPSAALDIAVDQSVLPVDDGLTSVHARLTDRYGNTTPEVRNVVFAATGGSISPPAMATSGGVATASYRASAVAGRYAVSADADGLQATANLTLRPADLAIAMAEVHGPRGRARSSQTYPGEALSYTIAARNRGLATARGVVLAAELPDPLGRQATSASRPVSEIGAVPPGLLGPPAGGRHQRAWRLPDLTTGEAVTITVSGELDRTYPWSGFDTLFFRTVVTTTTAVATIAELGRSDTAHVYAADLYVTIELDGEASSLRPGGQMVYDIGFGNLQQQTAVGPVRITDTLPALARFDHWQPETGVVLRPAYPFDRDASELVWEFDGSFGLSQGLRLWLAIAPDAPPESVLENIVSIGSSVPDVRLENNRHFDGGVMLRGVNLIAEIDGPATVAPGEELGYEITVRNAARLDTAHDVVLISSPPTDATVIRTDPPGLVLLDGSIRWQVPDLAAGGWRRFELVTRVPDRVAVGAYYHNRAEVTSRDLESYSGDNSDESWTRIVPGLPASVTVRPGAGALTACSGEKIRLTAVVRDRVGNTVADGTLVCWAATAGTLSQAEASTLDGLAVTDLTAGRSAGSAGVSADAGSARGTTSVDIVPGAPASLAVSADPSRLRRGGRAFITVNVLDACSNVVADGWSIELEAERGSFAGAGRAVLLPTAAGRVRAALTVNQESGPLRVSARHGSIMGEAVLSVEDRSVYELYIPAALRR